MGLSVTGGAPDVILMDSSVCNPPEKRHTPDVCVSINGSHYR